jgi:hypothetical protein
MKHVSIVVMSIVYLLASVRYFPADLLKTGTETLFHMVSAAPLTIGCTLLFVIFFQKTSKGKLPWDRILRIYLMLAIFFELILGLQNYVGKG